MRYEATVRSLDDVDYGEDFVTVSTLGQAIMAYYQAPTLKTAPRVPAFSFGVAPTLSVGGVLWKDRRPCSQQCAEVAGDRWV